MEQLHKRFTDEQIAVMFQLYCQGVLTRVDAQEMLSIGKTLFFASGRQYRQDTEAFSLSCKRTGRAGLSLADEGELELTLLQEKDIVEDKRLPISCYDYSAMRDRLAKKGIKVSVTTIISRAKRLGRCKPRKKRKTHDREVLTASIGPLIQHDAPKLLLPKRSGFSSLASTTSAASCHLPISSARRPPGPISRPPKH